MNQPLPNKIHTRICNRNDLIIIPLKISKKRRKIENCDWPK